MQPLDLNLASRPFKNDTLPWVGLVTAVVGLAVLTVWNIRTYRSNAHLAEDLRKQYAANREEMEQFDGRERKAQRNIEEFNLEALNVRADKANEVIRWKAFSWTQLFNLLQEVLPNDAQMISIRPVFRPQAGSQRGRDRQEEGRVPVSVEGVAKNLDAFFELERALLAHPHFDRVDPGGHTQDRTRTVAFQLKFLYDPSPVLEAVNEGTDGQGAASEAAPDAVETPAADPKGIAEGAVDQADTPPVPDPEAPLATGEPTEAELPAAETLAQQATGEEAVPSVAEQEAAAQEEEQPNSDAAIKKPGRRKSGKRRSGSGRGTEGDR